MNHIKQSGLVGLFVLLSGLFGTMQAMNNNMNNNINNNQQQQQNQFNSNNFLVTQGYLNGAQPIWPTEFVDTTIKTTEKFTEVGLPQQVEQPIFLNISPDVTLQVDDQGNETWTESGSLQQVESNLHGRNHHFLTLNIAPVIAYTKQITEKVTVTKFIPGNQQGPNNNNNQ